MTEARINDILHETAHRFPRAWSKAHREGDPERWDYIILSVNELYREDRTVRGNWRRGVQGDLSMDGLSVLIDGQWRFADVIGGAGGSNPQIGYRTPGPESALRDGSGRYIGEAGAPTPMQIQQHKGWTHVDYGVPPVDGGPVEPQPRTYTPLEALAEIEAHVGRKLAQDQITELVNEAFRLGYQGTVTEAMLAQLKVYAERWRDPQQPTTVTVERAALEHILVELQHAAADIQRLLS